MSRRSCQSPTTKSLGAIGVLVWADNVVIQSPVFDLNAGQAPDHVDHQAP